MLQNLPTMHFPNFLPPVMLVLCFLDCIRLIIYLYLIVYFCRLSLKIIMIGTNNNCIVKTSNVYVKICQYTCVLSTRVPNRSALEVVTGLC